MNRRQFLKGGMVAAAVVAAPTIVKAAPIALPCGLKELPKSMYDIGKVTVRKYGDWTDVWQWYRVYEGGKECGIISICCYGEQFEQFDKMRVDEAHITFHGGKYPVNDSVDYSCLVNCKKSVAKSVVVEHAILGVKAYRKRQVKNETFIKIKRLVEQGVEFQIVS